MWYSVSPYDGSIVPYPPFVNDLLNAAKHSGRQTVHIPTFFNATIHLASEPALQTTPEIRGRMGKPAGLRQVICKNPGAVVHVDFKNGRWDLSERDIPSSVERMVPTAMDTGETWIWEWCESLSLAHASERSWHSYATEVQDALEAKWNASHDNFEHAVTIGLREYVIDVVRTNPFFRQKDENMQKVRWVRRRFGRPAAHSPTLTEDSDSCALCCETYGDTRHMPCIRLSSCTHIFHAACLQPLLDRHQPCPLCRCAMVV